MVRLFKLHFLTYVARMSEVGWLGGSGSELAFPRLMNWGKLDLRPVFLRSNANISDFQSIVILFNPKTPGLFGPSDTRLESRLNGYRSITSPFFHPNQSNMVSNES